MAPPDENNLLLSLCGISKTFGGVTALSGVDLNLRAGEVHALCGENGAGKSTCMKIIAGAEHPDQGHYLLQGEEVSFRSVADANDKGVAIVFQELSLFPDFDVVQNIFMGREPGRLGLIDRALMERKASPVFELLGLSIDVKQPVGSLRIADQQLVEIAKALALDAKVLILDEPNSSLNAEESERLFQVINDLRMRGTGILYSSHRLEEVVKIADRVSVLRNGEKVAEHIRGRLSIKRIVNDMLGDKADQVASRIRRTLRKPVSEQPRDCLRVEGLKGEGVLEECSFVAAPGEVVGFAGLEGAGSEEVFDILFGRKNAVGGTVNMPGNANLPPSIRAAVKAGVAMVPADRRTEGLALSQDILGNMNTVVTGGLGRLGFVPTKSAMTELAAAQAKALNLRHGGFENEAESLSGGNQQKIVIGKWLAANPTLVLLNDPTRGVDIGAKDEIYRIIDRLADEGRIVLFISSELNEYSLVCDRVLLFYDGKTVGELAGNIASEHALLEAINIGQISRPESANSSA